MVGQRREGTIPFPEMVAITPTSENVQRASNVRTIKGQLVHTFEKLAIAMLAYSNF